MLILKRIIFTVILIAVAVGVFILSSNFQYNTIKDRGRQQEQLTRKLAEVAGVWGTLKITSGVISLLETIEISIPVVGGVSLEPLGWTAVVDNTLDHMSNICLWAMGAIVIEKILLAVSVWFSIKIIVPLCIALIIVAIWSQRFSKRLLTTVLGIILIFTAICIAIPLSLEMSNIIEKSILSNYIDETIQDIASAADEAEKTGEETQGSGFMDWIKKIGSGIAGFFEKAKKTFDHYIDKMIDYIMCFILTNILIPIGTIFGLKYLVALFLSLIGFKKGTEVIVAAHPVNR